MSRRKALQGEIRLPGDKSISHRALILGAMAEGTTVIEGLSDGDDVRSTWHCLQGLGVQVSSRADRAAVKGRGWRGLQSPIKILDAGNSGTTLRLLTGLIAGNPIAATLTGDDSLRRRPMGRLAEPLRRMGATVELTDGEKAPVTVRGAALKAVDFISPVASAQLKSAVLLAGLLASGETSVTEPALSRDHTERMLPHFGIIPRREQLKVTVRGGLHLSKAQIAVPGDASSAAFWVVAGTLVPGSELRLIGVGVNPTRTGFLEVLSRMGAAVQSVPQPAAHYGMEPAADLVVRGAPLESAEISPEEVPGLIDEIPILALAASQAEGTSRFRGLSELRHKETDRLEGIAKLLSSLGAKARVERDDLVVEGPRRLQGARVNAGGDHRLAMTAMVAGLVSQGEVQVEDPDCVKISYPSFLEELRRLHG